VPADPADQAGREGGLAAPTRHPIPWQSPAFWERPALDTELHRVFDICHGCRRCVSLCNAFPSLFDLVDHSTTLEMDGVAPADYGKVVEHCYLCDLCYLTKCPYVPPHPWNVDFPHLMLRAKAVARREGGTGLRDRLLSRPDLVGWLAGIPVVTAAVVAAERSRPLRNLLHETLGVHRDAPLPEPAAVPLAARACRQPPPLPGPPRAGQRTRGRVGLFATCYGNAFSPDAVEDLIALLTHNGIEVRVVGLEGCCGMPKLELGDLDAVAAAKERHLPGLLALVEEGFDLLAPVPSCVLMFRQELPLLFPEDADCARLAAAFRDPFEYLWLRHRDGLLRTDFVAPLGRVLYHAACHQRVQRIGPKTREVLELVPGTEVQVVERCSGHDGTYAVKVEYHEAARRIGRPVAAELAAVLERSGAAHFTSDCPMAGGFVASAVPGAHAESPFRLLCHAYGLGAGAGPGTAGSPGLCSLPPHP
jgi:Fe-S oxidoreductase